MNGSLPLRESAAYNQKHSRPIDARIDGFLRVSKLRNLYLQQDTKQQVGRIFMKRIRVGTMIMIVLVTRGRNFWKIHDVDESFSKMKHVFHQLTTLSLCISHLQIFSLDSLPNETNVLFASLYVRASHYTICKYSLINSWESDTVSNLSMKPTKSGWFCSWVSMINWRSGKCDALKSNCSAYASGSRE